MACLTLTGAYAYGQASDKPSFEVVSIKPSSPSAHSIQCKGGPGTNRPGIWECSNVPLVFLISRAYTFQPYELAWPGENGCWTDG